MSAQAQHGIRHFTGKAISGCQIEIKGNASELKHCRECHYR